MENNQPEHNDTITPLPTTKEGDRKTEYTLNENTIMASVAYLGPLVLVPFLTKRDNSFIMFHVRQGLVLFGIWVISFFAVTITLGLLESIVFLIKIGLLILSIIGILNALQMKEEILPITGKLAEKIHI